MSKFDPIRTMRAEAHMRLMEYANLVEKRSQGGCCGNCAYIEQVKFSLRCSLKFKEVKKYNICGHHER